MRHDKDKLGLFLGFSVLVKESLKDPFVKTIFLFVAFSIKLFYFTFSSGRTLTRLWLAVENSNDYFTFLFDYVPYEYGLLFKRLVPSSIEVSPCCPSKSKSTGLSSTAELSSTRLLPVLASV